MTFLTTNEGMLLIALGIGYIVLYLAKREEKGLQFLGYLIGTLLISISALLIIKNFILGGCFLSKKGMMEHRMMAPQGMMPQAPQPQK